MPAHYADHEPRLEGAPADFLRSCVIPQILSQLRDATTAF